MWLTLSSGDLVFEDWKMTKDRIKHFDDVCVRIRIGGVPIATAIIGAGLASFEYTSKIIFSLGGIGFNATSIVILFGTLYLLPIAALDALHYHLMLLSVKHARQIEQQDTYKNKLQITTKLTSPTLTTLHTVIAAVIYVALFITGLFLAIAVNYLPTP